MVYEEDIAAEQVAELIHRLGMRRGNPRRRLRLSWAECPVTHPLEDRRSGDPVEQKVIDLVVAMRPRLGGRLVLSPATDVMTERQVAEVISQIVELGRLLGVEGDVAA